MIDDPLKKLESLGQSIWLDHVRSDLISRGELKRMIEEEKLRGMTSNPANKFRPVYGKTNGTGGYSGLLSDLLRYRHVTEAYIKDLEARIAKGESVQHTGEAQRRGETTDTGYPGGGVSRRRLSPSDVVP